MPTRDTFRREGALDQIIFVTQNVYAGRVNRRPHYATVTFQAWARRLPAAPRDQVEFMTHERDEQVKAIWQVREPTAAGAVAYSPADTFVDPAGITWTVLGVQGARANSGGYVELLCGGELETAEG